MPVYGVPNMCIIISLIALAAFAMVLLTDLPGIVKDAAVIGFCIISGLSILILPVLFAMAYAQPW